MKKAILSLCFFIAVVTMVSAQEGAQQQAQQQPDRVQLQKDLKEQVMLTDEQIQSVMTISDEFAPRMKEIKMDKTMNEADRTAKIQALKAEKKARLETTLGKEAADKLEAYYSTKKGHLKEGKIKSEKHAPADK